MYPTTDSSNQPPDVPTDNCGWGASSSSAVWALLRNDDTIVLRSIIRRTRGVSLASEGTLYERINGALEEPIKREQQKRSALSAAAASNSWTVVKLCPQSVDFLLRVV